MCHACGLGGDIIKLVIITRESGFRDAVSWLLVFSQSQEGGLGGSREGGKSSTHNGATKRHNKGALTPCSK